MFEDTVQFFIQIHDFGVIKHGWQFFQAAKMSSTCSSNHCFTVTLLSIKQLNADPVETVYLDLLGTKTRTKMGLSSIILHYSNFFLDN